MIMENYPGHHFHLKIVSTKPTKKQVHLIIEITGLSKKKAHKLIRKGGYIKKNIPKKEFEQKLTHCAPQFVLATCERLKQHNMIFEVQTQNHTLHSGISTFFEDLQRLQ